MRLAWLRFRERMYQRVQEAGYTDLLPMHVMLFRYPTIEGMRPTQLAEQAGLSKQATNDLLRQLEAMGYIQRRRDPTDGRARLITLTGRGQRLMDLMYRFSSEIADEWEQRVGKQRLDAVRATLVELVEAEI